MRTARWSSLVLALVLAPALLAGCGSGSPGAEAIGADASTSPATGPAATPSTPAGGPASQTTGPPPSGSGGSTLPTVPGPSGPPRTPSDLIPTGVLVGTITADSDGSCYTLRTDDDDTYALVGGDGRPLAKGTVVRAKTTPDPPPPAGCAGQPVAITSIEPV